MVADYLYDLVSREIRPVIGELPATAEVATAIIEYDGAASIEYFGGQTGNSILKPVVKFVVRHSSYATGKQWIEQLKEQFHRYHDDTLMSVVLVGSPMYLGRGDTKLHEFQVTFQVQVKE